MSSLFLGIETALRGALAQQQAVNTAANNVANASTPGYSRQNPVFTAGPGSPGPSFAGYPDGGPMGTGVSVSEIRRMHDGYLSGRVRSAESSFSYWETQRQTAERVEDIVYQSGGSGLNTLLDRFWNAWQNFSQSSPDDAGIRSVVIAEGRNLAAGLNSAGSELARLGTDARSMLNDAVDRVNGLARGLADLNTQLRAVGGLGGQPNELLDQRDALLGELASLADADIYEGEFGAVNVSLGNRLLVQDTTAASLSVPPDSPARVLWQDGQAAGITQGEIGALMRVENEMVPANQANLDALRTTLVDRVNSLHAMGRDLDGNAGGVFLVITGSSNTVSVAPELDDPRKLAISADGSPGNADIARAIADLRNTPLAELGNVSMREHFSTWLSAAGAEARELGDMAGRTRTRRDSLQTEQDGVSGVNLDEEAARLVQWQRAFSASARVLTVLDDMLVTVIDRIGVR